ncbi:MAG: class I SAM-dependent methyltransferase [Patescibacteria group bacterium]
MNHEEQDKLFHRETADSYDQDIVRPAAVYHDIFLKPWLKTLKGDEKLLDYGCGTGCLTESILPHVGWYTGIDHSPEMLGIARQKVNSAKANLIIGDCLQLPFIDESFSAVVCQGIFHHLSDASRGLKEVIRVAKPQAKIFISEPIKAGYWLRKIKGFFSRKIDNGSVEEPLDLEKFLRMAKLSGLDYKTYYSIWLPGPRLFQQVVIRFFGLIGLKGDMVFIYGEKKNN